MKSVLKICLAGLIFALLQVSFGQKIKIRTVSGGLGISVPEWKWGIGIAPEAEIGLGEIVKDIYWHPFLSFWYNRYTQENVTASLKQLLFGVKLLYYLDYKYEGPYVGGGFSYHLLYPDHLKKHSISQTYYIQETVETRVAVFALAGFLFKYKTLRPYLESKFFIIPGGYSAFQLLGGVLHKF
jgi:hypothetical protein